MRPPMTMNERDSVAIEDVQRLAQEQGARWREKCYVDTNVDGLFADPARSVVVVTHAGCGISTSLAQLHSYGLLSFSYDLDQWPGQKRAFTKAPDHFGQWMAQIAYTFVDLLRQEPNRLAALSRANLEFVTWLVYHHLSQRQRRHWTDLLQARLPDETWQQLQATISDEAFAYLFGTTVSDLVEQIDECLDLARQLGWRGIFASVDLRWSDWIKRPPEQRLAAKEGLSQLLTTLTPLQRPGFGFKMGVPRRLFSLQEVRALVRGRATVADYDWPAPKLVEVADRLIAQAISEKDTALRAAVLPSERWHDLAADLALIWETPGPAAAVALALHALELARESQNTLENLRRHLYRSSARLQIDNDLNQGQVWRGMEPIKLTERPFDIFKALWERRGELVSNDELVDLAGSKGNVDTNIKRVRQALEPFYKEKERNKEEDFLYIRRDQYRGAWLDKDCCVFD